MINHDRIVTFDVYYDPMLAHILRTKLLAAGMPCYIADENILWAKPFINQALGGVKIRVFENDLERCKAILATETDLQKQGYFYTDNENNAEMICPYCGSANVRYGTATVFKFHLASLLVSLLVGVPFYFRNAWHCFNCHRDF